LRVLLLNFMIIRRLEMTNEEWVDGFKIVLFILFVIGVLILYAHDIKVEHTDCISHGGQWVHGLNTDGTAQYYCIEPPGM
jgi:hypothetical protein